MMRIVNGAFMALVLSGCPRHPGIDDRPANWASPVEVLGVENLHRVSADLYRSEQPMAEAGGSLKRLGIETVVSLRAFHGNRGEIVASGLNHEKIPFHTWDPDEEELIRFLKVVTDPQKTPVLVHCWHGSDRTGAMCAAYRVVVQGWSKADAIREMKEGGFGHHKIWSHLADWVEGLEVDQLQRTLESAPTALECGGLPPLFRMTSSAGDGKGRPS